MRTKKEPNWILKAHEEASDLISYFLYRLWAISLGMILVGFLLPSSNRVGTALSITGVIMVIIFITLCPMTFWIIPFGIKRLSLSSLGKKGSNTRMVMLAVAIVSVVFAVTFVELKFYLNLLEKAK